MPVIDWLFTQPIFSIPQLSEMLSVSYSVAQRYVTQLEQTSTIEEITGQARNRVYRADEILSVVAREM